MLQTCSKCSRSNPEEAVYCYFDGFVLGNGARGGPMAIGAQAFLQPFVFTSGRPCRNFNELALACQEEWKVARGLLQEGYLENFFKGLGRADLALAAKEASKFPDHDRGLDDLLSKLPGDVLAAPQLSLETKDVNLGTLKVGASREFDLHLENQGMRLLHGTVSCADAKNVWLTLGDTPGTTEKHFQFGHEQTIKVKVCGDRLRAGKPMELKLLVDSNGGQAAVTVRCEVPVQPFPDGVLAGAKSPRDLAMKAKKQTKEAAPLFEQGAVEEWYKANGWNYPVTGPAFSGLHAIQQFFEALGLVKPPVVEINARSISLTGNPGDQLTYEIKVESQEKKPVYAHAVCDENWLVPSKAKLNGRVATINVVAAVPNRPGKTLNAKLTVQANGNQRFEVPVSLAVQGSAFDFNGPTAEVEEVVAVVETPPPPTPSRQVAVVPAGAPSPVVVEAAVVGVQASPPVSTGGEAAFGAMRAEAPSSGGSSYRRRKAEKFSPLHLIPAGILVLAILGFVVADLTARRPNTNEPDGPPKGGTNSDLWSYGGVSGDPRLFLQFDDNRPGSFGLEMTKEDDPNVKGQKKRLTYDSRGKGDNIIVKIDGLEFFYGMPTTDRPNSRKALPKGRIGQVNIKQFKQYDVEVRQHVELVPGSTGLLDTCLVWFTITNHSKERIHDVGLRVLMDTFIGANDGVPFTIPGQKGFLDTMKEFGEKQVPDYIEAIEKPEDPKNPGTVVRMGLHHIKLPGIDLEPIDKMRICLYPGSQTKWDWDMEPMNKNPMQKDSCVALYWVVQKMNPGDVRQLGYTYGLSELSIGAGDSPVALSAPTTVQPNSEFVITAYVWKAFKGQKLTLELPSELTLVKDELAEKSVDETAGRVQLSWRVKAGAAGEYTVTAKTAGGGGAKPLKIVVRKASIFG